MTNGIMRVKEEYIKEARKEAEGLIKENYSFLKNKLTGYITSSSIGIEKYKKVLLDEITYILAIERSITNIDKDVVNEKSQQSSLDVKELLSKYDAALKEGEEKPSKKREIKEGIILKYAMLGGFGAAYIELIEEIENPKNAVIFQKCKESLGKVIISLPDSMKKLLKTDQAYIEKIWDYLDERNVFQNIEERDFGLLYSKFVITKLRYDLQKEDLKKNELNDKLYNRLKKLRLQLNGIALSEMDVEDVKNNRKIGDPVSNTELLSEIEHVEWEDVIGQTEAKKILRDSVVRFLGTYDHITKQSIFERVLGTKPPKAILLYGPPGTGKTHILKAAITESERIREELIKNNKLNPGLPNENKRIYFNIITPDQIKDKYIGESSKAIKAVFTQAKKEAPSLLVIDELDAFFSKRGDRGFNEGEREIVSILLQELEGIKDSTGYILVGITNMPKLLDRAILSRFDQKVEFFVPKTKEEVAELFKVHLRGLVNSNGLPKMTEEDWQKLGEIGHNLSFTGRMVKQFSRLLEQERNDLLTEIYQNNSKIMEEYYKNPEKMKSTLTEKSKRYNISYICQKMGEFASHQQHSETYTIE